VDYDTINQVIKKMIDKYDNIDAIGIGIPGLVNNGAIDYCDTEKLNGVNLKDLLSKEYNLPIIVDNIMHLMAYGYYKKHPELAEDVLAIIFAPANFIYGAGFVIDGRVLKGYHNLSGEIRYLPHGLSLSALLNQLNTKKYFIPIIVQAISSIVPIISPSNIILTGSLFNETMLSEIKESCLKNIPSNYLPELSIDSNYEENYLQGIIAQSVEAIKGGIQLIKN